MKKKLKHLHKTLKSKLEGNYLALLNLLLSLIILARVELVNRKLDMIMQGMIEIYVRLSLTMQAAQDQFGAAIQSILSLFGGDGA